MQTYIFLIRTFVRIILSLVIVKYVILRCILEMLCQLT